MCIPHLKSRCTETGSELFLLYLYIHVCPLLNFGLVRGGGWWGVGGEGGRSIPLSPCRGNTEIICSVIPEILFFEPDWFLLTEWPSSQTEQFIL